MFTFVNLTKQQIPRIPFSKIYKTLLKKNYELSLVFIGHARSKRLNKQFRNKDKSANVLTFPLSDDSGEIFITVPMKNKEDFELSDRKYMALLFIHGILHLRGEKHGKKMEKREEFLLKNLI